MNLGFGSRVVEALASGIDVLESLMLLVVRLWVFVVLGVAGFVLVKRYGGKRFVGRRVD